MSNLPSFKDMHQQGLCDSTREYIDDARNMLTEKGLCPDIEIALDAALGHEVSCRALFQDAYGKDQAKAVYDATLQVVMWCEWANVPMPLEVGSDGRITALDMDVWRGRMAACRDILLKQSKQHLN